MTRVRVVLTNQAALLSPKNLSYMQQNVLLLAIAFWHLILRKFERFIVFEKHTRSMAL